MQGICSLKSIFGRKEIRAIEKKLKLLNNVTLPSVAHDKQANIACKEKNKFMGVLQKGIFVLKEAN